jgi:hypothetical protein
MYLFRQYISSWDKNLPRFCLEVHLQQDDPAPAFEDR